MEENEGTYLSTVVIGGGQSGLATGYHLKRLGVKFEILDANDRVGDAWRDRWGSLRLFTPGRYDSLPGMPYPGLPHSLPGKDDIADYLESYAARFQLPVRHGMKVNRFIRQEGRYLVVAGDESILTDNVVVATGAFGNPRIPDFAETLSPASSNCIPLSTRRQSRSPRVRCSLWGRGSREPK